MSYNLDEIIDRTGTNAIKWEPSVLKDMFRHEDALSMWVADMDFKCPPAVISALSNRVAHGIFGYSDKDAAYDDAIINWFKRRHDFEIKNDWIVFTPGVVPAVNYIVQAFCNPGDKVIIQNPVYYPFSTAIENNGAVIVHNPLINDDGRYVMDYKDLAEKAKDPKVKLMILCNPHNPVGRVWEREELLQLGEICIENDVLVVSDEIHCDLIMSGHKHIPFATLSEAFKLGSITCTAPSKTFNLAGLQMSNIIIPNESIRLAYQNRLKKNAIMHPNAFGIVALKAAYNESEEWLKGVLRYVEANFDYMEHFIGEKIPQVKFSKPEGTYLAWLDFRGLGLDTKELEDFMQNKLKLALDEGYIFGEGGEGFERINVACPRAFIEDALTRIEKAIATL